MLADPAAVRRHFVEQATKRFTRDVPDFARLRRLIQARGGRLVNDHGAIRSADPARTNLFVRAARQMGLERELDYSFPSKKLESFDLQVPGDDATHFKIFVSEVDHAAFSGVAQAALAADVAATADEAGTRELKALLDHADGQGGVTPEEGEQLVALVFSTLMKRAGAPIRRDVLEAVARESGAAASALVLGLDFNHITVDVKAAGFASIDEMAAVMQAEGFQMLPAIQGAPGTKLRQTATMAQTMDTPVLEADGHLGSAQTEKQFVEIIERGPYAQDHDGNPVIFKNFLAANADKIFDAASTKSKTDAQAG